MEDCVKNFTERGRKESDWVFVTIVSLAQTQEQRVENREISPAILRNYVKAVKMSWEKNDIVITWKKIIRDVPRARKFADVSRIRRQNRCCKNDSLCR